MTYLALAMQTQATDQQPEIPPANDAAKTLPEATPPPENQAEDEEREGDLENQPLPEELEREPPLKKTEEEEGEKPSPAPDSFIEQQRLSTAFAAKKRRGWFRHFFRFFYPFGL